MDEHKSVAAAGTDLPTDVEADADVPDGQPEPTKQCIAPRCHNYGNERNNFLCNSCLSYVKREIEKRYSGQQVVNGTCPTPTCPNNTTDMCTGCTNIFLSRKSPQFTTQMSKEKCQTATCPNFGHLNKGNLCNDCYHERQFSCSTKNCPNFSLAKNDFLCNSCSKARSSVKCSSPNCLLPALPVHDGKCRMCYLKSLEPVAHTPGSFGDASSTSTAHSATHTLPTVVIGDQTTEWKMCGTAGCSNVETKDGFCTQCLLLRYSDKHTHKTECTTEGCFKQGLHHFNNHCPDCYNSNKEILKFQPAAQAGASKKCITPDCEFFGSQEHSGLCSKCFKNYTEITETNLPGSPTNKKCRNASCEYFANPETDGLCSSCYKDYLYQNDTPTAPNNRRRHASGPSAIRETENASLRRDVLDMTSLVTARQLSFEQTSDSNTITPRVKGPVEAWYRGPESTNRPMTSAHATQLSSQFSASDLKTQGSKSNQQASSAQSSSNASSVASGPSTLTTSTSFPEFRVLSDQCKNQQCEKKCVKETYPYCLSCFENLNLQPKPTTPQASMPLSRNNSESLGLSLGNQGRMRSVSNPDLNSLSDECERPGCLNPTSASTYPLCLRCAGSPETQSVQDSQAVPMVGTQPDSQPAGRQAGNVPTSKDGNPNNALTPKRVSLKPVTKDPASIECDVMLCLWSKDQATTGMHPLLTKLVIDWNQEDTPQLMLGGVVMTDGGVSKARCLLHCKYDRLDKQAIANSLLKLVFKAEAMKAEHLILPVQFLESLNKNPQRATDVCLYVINNFQKSGKYVKKFYVCFGSIEQVKKCKEEFVKVEAQKVQLNQAGKGNQKVCHTCRRNPQAKLKPMSLECENPTCSRFCLPCLKRGRKDKLICPDHGDCLAPVGHKNTFALLVAGFDSERQFAEVFIKDVKQMKEVLTNQNYIGVSPENCKVITATEPGVEEDIKGRLRTAFAELRIMMQGKDHVMLFFFYSGHNNKKALKLGSETNTITPKQLRRELRSLDAENILITLDCCYSGGANLTEKIDEKDFIMSLDSCSKDDSEPVTYLPKLWNLEDDDLDTDCGAKGNDTNVYQWSSSVAYHKSYFIIGGDSFFTLCIVKILAGRCPFNDKRCKECVRFKQETVVADGVFLHNISKSVYRHVYILAKKRKRDQHPQLEGHEEDILVAFHDLP